MNTAKSVRDLMGPADPAADIAGDTALAEAGLERILRDEAAAHNLRHPRPRARIRLRLAVAGVAVSAVVGAVLVWPDGTPAAFAATPPALTYHLTTGDGSGAATQLEEIARRVEGLPDGAGGEQSHLRWRQWALWTRTDAGGTSSKVVPEELDLVRSPGGAKLTRFLVDEGPASATEQAAQETLQGEVPQSADALRVWLRSRTSGVDGPAGAAEAVHDLVTERVLSPGQRAAVLRLLAALPGMAVSGEVVDRAGRPGVAFSADSAASGLPTRYTFIVDPVSGQLLGQEETLTESAGKLNVPVPSVIGYDAY
ncbi:CU044_5270 family protein, partial [Kitasatospora sp. NPDC057223]|uniref:CU044_5270 family protein n=1 Tax=Kitasatospora sp. NPDC057223 TaxID=3346055 RepID=UPI0036273981